MRRAAACWGSGSERRSWKARDVYVSTGHCVGRGYGSTGQCVGREYGSTGDIAYGMAVPGRAQDDRHSLCKD
eukprot:3574976-Rhodomonas_salina.2